MMIEVQLSNVLVVKLVQEFINWTFIERCDFKFGYFEKLLAHVSQDRRFASLRLRVLEDLSVDPLSLLGIMKALLICFNPRRGQRVTLVAPYC